MKRLAATLPVALAPIVLALLSVSCLGGFGRTRAAEDPFRGRGPLVFPEDLRARSAPPEDSFQIVEFAPSAAPGEGSPTVPWENLEGGIWVLFNRPVVPAGATPLGVQPGVGQSPGARDPGTQEPEIPALRVHPPLDGRLRWYGSRLLAFEPAGSLEPALEYLVTVDPQLHSLAGQPLEGLNAFRFRTPALELVSLTPAGRDVEPEDCRELRLLFNFPVELDSLVPSLRLEAARVRPDAGAGAAGEPAEGAGGDTAPRYGAGRRLRFQASYDPHASGDDLLAKRVVVITPKRELPWNSRVTVRLRAGARPGPRNYRTEAEQSLSFTTLEPFALVRSEVHDWLPTVEAALVFNHPVSRDNAAAFVQVELPGYDTADNLEVYGAAVVLRNLPVPFESTFRVRLRAGLEDLYGQRLPQDRELELGVGPAAAYARVRAQGERILEAGFPPVVAAEFQNVSEGGYSAGRLADPFEPIPEGPLEPIPVDSLPRNTRLFRLLDLSPFLDQEGKGSAFARFRFTVPDPWSEGSYPVLGDLRLQVTDLGLSAHLAPNRITVRVASLSTGAPMPGAQVLLGGARGEWRRGRSGADGVSSFTLEPGELKRFLEGAEESLRIEVANGRDRLVFVPSAAPSKNWNHYGLLHADEPRPATYLVSDRGIYRPGETVSFFGIDRDVVAGRLQARSGGYRIRLQRGWYGDAAVAENTGRLTATGRFWGEFALPEGLEPDEYVMVYAREDGTHREYAPVRIAFFRRVGFAVEVDLPGDPRFMGEPLEGRFSGHYLAGGEVTRGRWSYWWARRPIFYSPPDPGGVYAGFRFGDFPVYGGYEEDYGFYTEDLSSDEGTLGGDGRVRAVQPLAGGRPGRVYEYSLTATIEDLDRQTVSRRAALPVFTSSLLIGARPAADPQGEEPVYFVRSGEPFALQVCWVRPDGRPYGGTGGESGRDARSDPVPPSLAVRLLREQWTMVRERSIGGRIDTRWVREEVEEGRFTLEPPTGADARGRLLAALSMRTARVGAYVAELRAADDRGREALTRVDFYSTGSANVLWRRGDETRIELVPDRPSYAPGERARLLIKSPLERGSYLMTVEREGILEERFLELDGTTDTVEVDIREEHVPRLYVSLSGSTGRTAPPPGGPDAPDLGKPRGVFGSIGLAVSAESRRIELEIEPSRDSYAPGAEAQIRVRATWNGRPLEGAEILVVAADRGVLDLIDYHLGDPLSYFYAPYRFAHGVAHYDSRDLLIDPVLWKLQEMPGGDKEGMEAAGGPVAVRKDFRATALFEPGLRTDARGLATARFRLPDQLSRFRVTAVAVHSGPGDSGPAGDSGAVAGAGGQTLPPGERYGLAEQELVVQNPVNVRPALPRSLRIGDRARAGVVVTNLDDRSHGVRVRLESGLLAQGEPAEQTLSVGPGDSREMAFALAATQEGPAALSFHVDAEVLREILEVQLPVERSTVRESFTLIGQTDDRVEEALVLPERFVGTPDEGLAVTLDSTLASSLVGAIRFLELYPYDCLEQRTSKLFAYLLYDWLLADREVIVRELEALGGYQTEEGGMSFWPDPGFRRPGYYVSLRAAHLLHLAAGAGYPAGGPPAGQPSQSPAGGEAGVPAGADGEQPGATRGAGVDREALLRYLQEHYHEQGRYLQAYALHVLALHGRDIRRPAGILGRRPDLSLAERSLLGLAYLDSGERSTAEGQLSGMRNYFRVGTRSITLVEPHESWPYYGGSLQAKALLLMLYSRLAPDSQIAQALADDLLASARKGYWANTSNTGWVLQAFAEVIAAGGDRSAEFVARVRLGERPLAEHRFSGISRGPHTVRVEPGLLVAEAAAANVRAGRDDPAAEDTSAATGRRLLPLAVSREGRGRLYYSLSLSYALPAEAVGARDEGIGLFSEILDLAGGAIGDTLQLGQVYRLRVVVYSSRDRDFLAVRVPLPAGAEALDGTLATTESLPARALSSSADPDSSRRESWYDRPVQRIYDNEVRLFYDSFYRGKREFSFLFRTTTPGVFTVPPTTAELMYEEEVFGRTGGREIRIGPQR